MSSSRRGDFKSTWTMTEPGRRGWSQAARVSNYATASWWVIVGKRQCCDEQPRVWDRPLSIALRDATVGKNYTLVVSQDSPRRRVTVSVRRRWLLLIHGGFTERSHTRDCSRSRSRAECSRLWVSGSFDQRRSCRSVRFCDPALANLTRDCEKTSRRETLRRSLVVREGCAFVARGGLGVGKVQGTLFFRALHETANVSALSSVARLYILVDVTCGCGGLSISALFNYESSSPLRGRWGSSFRCVLRECFSIIITTH